MQTLTETPPPAQGFAITSTYLPLFLDFFAPGLFGPAASKSSILLVALRLGVARLGGRLLAALMADAERIMLGGRPATSPPAAHAGGPPPSDAGVATRDDGGGPMGDGTRLEDVGGGVAAAGRGGAAAKEAEDDDDVRGGGGVDLAAAEPSSALAFLLTQRLRLGS